MQNQILLTDWISQRIGQFPNKPIIFRFVGDPDPELPDGIFEIIFSEDMASPVISSELYTTLFSESFAPWPTGSFFPVFLEDGEIWSTNNTYATLFSEQFSSWSQGDFLMEFSELFNTPEWSYFSSYNVSLSDNLNSQGWFLENIFPGLFSENFEQGGW